MWYALPIRSDDLALPEHRLMIEAMLRIQAQQIRVYRDLLALLGHDETLLSRLRAQLCLYGILELSIDAEEEQSLDAQLTFTPAGHALVDAVRYVGQGCERHLEICGQNGQVLTRV